MNSILVYTDRIDPKKGEKKEVKNALAGRKGRQKKKAQTPLCLSRKRHTSKSRPREILRTGQKEGTRQENGKTTWNRCSLPPQGDQGRREKKERERHKQQGAEKNRGGSTPKRNQHPRLPGRSEKQQGVGDLVRDPEC